MCHKKPQVKYKYRIKNSQPIKAFINTFSINIRLMQKPGSWFLLAKYLKNTCGRVTF